MDIVDHGTRQHPVVSFAGSCSYWKDCIDNNDELGQFVFPDTDSCLVQSSVAMVPLSHSF